MRLLAHPNLLRRAIAYVRLGRVSNLPTVWSNVLAGVALATGALPLRPTVLLVVAMTLFYEGGMLLNDALDHRIDARERPERPIPSGLVGVREVLAVGVALLAGGVALCATLGRAPLAGGLALAGAIVAYDVWHKGNPLAPIVMAACRVLVYVTAALAFPGGLHARVLIGALVLGAYLVGLTEVARRERAGRLDRAWPLLLVAAPVGYCAVVAHGLAGDVATLVLAAWIGRTSWALVDERDLPRAVGRYLAGISLLDAALLTSAGCTLGALLAVGAFALTQRLHRVVAGT